MQLGFLRGLLAVNLTLGLLPVAAMLVYSWLGLHGEQVLVAAPNGSVLAGLATTGVLVPLLGLTYVVKRLVGDSTRFRVADLCAAYVSLAVVFAGAMFLLQAASSAVAFAGMTTIWGGPPVTFQEHASRMLAAFGEAAYLSVTTITTLGYGDLAPVSPWARLLAAVECLAGVGFIGLVLGHYFSVCTHHAPAAPADRSVANMNASRAQRQE